MDSFAEVLAKWQLTEGRQTLPWQKYSTPYERLVSEFMLQQTQVETVIPYFSRFLAQFPTVESLAAAAEDDVFALWAGLGYYTRASNLRKAAQCVVNNLGGVFPTDVEGLMQLPGVGPSTAAAVAAFTSAEASRPMIDGNVKRVLSRVFRVEGRIGEKSFEKAIEARAVKELPGSSNIAAYTQGLMDLGSSICRRTNPRCNVCPMASRCEAHCRGEETMYPGKRLPPKRTVLRVVMVFVLSGKRDGKTEPAGVWLHKINERSIWKGLWTPLWAAWPAEEVRAASDEAKMKAFCQEQRDKYLSECEVSECLLPKIRHDLTHRRLLIEPRLWFVSGEVNLKGYVLFSLDALPGMPKPVTTLLAGIEIR